VQGLCLRYTFGDNGLPIGWNNYKHSCMENEYGGGVVSNLWKSWHGEGVDVITKNKDHSMKWCEFQSRGILRGSNYEMF
jgi:hypothetical protein